MQRRPWRARPQDPVRSRDLASRLQLSHVTAQCLINRGIVEPARARAFLRPTLSQLSDPHVFPAMRTAAERLLRAVRNGERIAIVGDYDVDGLTATALLVRLLRLLGSDPLPIVPDRLRDGYGMRPQHVRLAASRGASVIVTVDNGSTAFAAAREARERGIDLIITDHHEPRRDDEGAVLQPPCLAMINPKAEPGPDAPRTLAGCGVAFKLAWALATEISPGKRASPPLRAFLLDALALVAIGTVADAVALLEENRALVRHGLRALSATRHAGLRALLTVCGLRAAPTADDLAFQIGPRLNAAGRLGEAELGLALLTCEDTDRAAALAERLDERNRRRRELEHTVLEQALQQVPSALERSGGSAIVIAGERWPLGVLGIVASRLVERFHRPAVVIGLEGERGRGSARSVAGLALHEALAACDAHLERHGGHAMAAGLEIRADRVAAFAEAFGSHVRRRLQETEDLLAPEPLELDLELSLGALNETLVHELEALGPHGTANEAPVFVARRLRLCRPPRRVGAEQRHLQLHLEHNGCVRRAIGFRLGERAAELLDAPHGIEAAFRPTISHFQGVRSVELQLVDVRAAR